MQWSPLVATAVLAAATLASRTNADVLTFSPNEPRWGDTLVVTYDTSADGAVLLPTQNVRLVAHTYSRERAEQVPFAVEREGALLVGRIPIEAPLSSLTLYFVSPHAWDQRHTASVMVRDADGAPAPGAHLMQMFNAGPSWMDEFDRELELHPDSIYAYRQKWFVAGAFDAEHVKETVERDLADLDARAEEHPTEWRYVQVFGRMTLGDEPAARRALLALLADEGDAFMTQLALSDYEYQCFAQGIEGAGPEAVAAAVRRAIIAHPDSPLARENAIRVDADEPLPLDTIEAIAAGWTTQLPENPLASYLLAQAYARDDDESARAIDHARRAVERLLAGDLVFHHEISGRVTRSYLLGAYRTWADVALRSGRDGDAIAASLAALEMQDQTSPRFHRLLARAWSGLGDFDRAADAWAAAYAAGDEEAEGALRDLYVARHERADGFEAFFAERTNASAEDDVARPPAPSFVVTDLAGRDLDLARLRGKVVVLNFWFIGCAPCKVEIPGLNALVAEYADRDDVVFIAFALDPADKLESFLAEHPFDYAIIPAAGAVAQQYGVGGYPTHVIIDPEGNVAARLVGGSKERHDDLRPLIERARR